MINLISLLTLDEHTNVESDMYKYPEVNKRQQFIKPNKPMRNLFFTLVQKVIKSF